MFDDVYLTIENPSEGLYKEKGSKFLGYAFPVRSEEEVKLHLAELRKLHPTARHHCYAYRLGADKQAYRANDDGEPSNTAGKPVLGQIQSNDLTNILIVVVRYFGGTLLGVGGLITAYKSAAADAISNSKMMEATVKEVYEINFDYLQMNDVMKILKDERLEMLEHQFELNCRCLFSVRKAYSVKVYDSMKSINGLLIKYLYTT
jgi:uncharacterized YigZ family protein